MSGLQADVIVEIIISKLYDVQAFSVDKDMTDGFVSLIGGRENCIVMSTTYDKLNISAEKFQNNVLYQMEDIWLTQNIDYALDDLLQEKESEVVGYFYTMMNLLNFYKFTKEEERLVTRFISTYDYNFLRDYHGMTAYDYKEYLNLRLLLRMYLSTIKRTKE